MIREKLSNLLHDIACQYVFAKDYKQMEAMLIEASLRLKEFKTLEEKLKVETAQKEEIKNHLTEGMLQLHNENEALKEREKVLIKSQDELDKLQESLENQVVDLDDENTDLKARIEKAHEIIRRAQGSKDSKARVLHAIFKAMDY